MFNRLIFKNELADFLLNRSGDSNNIANILIHGSSKHIKEVGNYIERDASSEDYVTYLPKSRYELAISEDPYQVAGRVRIKIGRFINKFIRKEIIESFHITSKSIEDFVNIYKSCFNRNEKDLHVVQGNDFYKWYLDTNYSEPGGMRFGTLWNSCMRYGERNKLVELYSQNTNIKMLVLLDDNNKLLARAILWDKVCDISGKVYQVMDRIYSVYDHDVNFFKNWAEKNNYIYKLEQNSKSERLFVKDGKHTYLDFSITLDKFKFDYYPYLDTFKFFDIRKGILSNSGAFNYQYVLVQANGSLEPDEVVEEMVEDDDD